MAKKGSTPEQSRAWYRDNVDHKRDYNRRYRLANRVRLAWLAARQKARRVGAAGDCTLDQVQARIDFYGGRCWICSAPWEHLDHVIPWALGGTNWPANIRPICGTCNVRKEARSPHDLSRPSKRGIVVKAAA